MKNTLIFLFYFIMMSLSRIEGFEFLLTKTLIPVFFVFGCFQYGKFRPRINNQVITLFIFLLICLFGLLNTLEIDSYLRTLQRLIGAIMAFFISINIIRNRSNFIHAAAGVTLGVFLGMVLSYQMGEASLTGSGRLSGLYDNPNVLAFSCLGGVIFSLVILNLIENKYKKLIVVFMVLFFIGAIFDSASRKSLTALALMMIYLIYFKISKKARLIFTLGLICTFCFSYLTNFDIFSLFSGDSVLESRLSADYIESSTTGRFDLISQSIDTFYDNWVFGVGLGNSQFHNEYGLMSHNDLVEVLVSSGIFGIILYIVFLLQYLIKSIQFLKFCRSYQVPKKTIELIRIAFIFFIVFLILGMGKPHFIDVFYMSFLGVFSALLFNLKGGLIFNDQ